jgi:hypothetical protein
MGQLLKVEQNTSLVRDVSSNAILNNNTSDYQNYIKNKQIALSKTNELSRQAEQINNLKQDMAEIKQMLATLIKGKE